MSGLEGDARITILFADRFRVHGQRTNSGLPRALNALPNQCIGQKKRGTFTQRRLVLIIPHATGRLKSLGVEGMAEDIEDIAGLLSHPAPVLECLSTDAGHKRRPHRHPV